MVTLTDTQVAADKAELLKTIETAQAKLKLLESVEHYMKLRAEEQPPELDEGPSETPPETEPALSNPPPRKPPPGRIEGLTEAIVSALREDPNPWMTANQIQEITSATLQREVPMSSVSPKLSDLKNKGVIRRDDKLVALASRVDEDQGL